MQVEKDRITNELMRNGSTAEQARYMVDLLASAVHEESAVIADKLTAYTIQQGDNLVLPVVGKTEKSLREKIKMLKDNGYTVELHYVDLPVAKAVEQGKSRFKETGRCVPIEYISSVGLKPKENIDKIKSEGEVDNYAEWNNDVARNSGPSLLEEGPQRLYSEGGLGGRGQSSLYEHGILQEDGTSERLNTDNTSRSGDTRAAFLMG